MNITVPAAAVAILLIPWLAPAAHSQESSSGTLLVDVRPHDSDVEMNKNVRKQLEHAGLEWGVVDPTFVFTMLNNRFANAELAQNTVRGEQGSRVENWPVLHYVHRVCSRSCRVGSREAGCPLKEKHHARRTASNALAR